MSTQDLRIIIDNYVNKGFLSIRRKAANTSLTRFYKSVTFELNSFLLDTFASVLDATVGTSFIFLTSVGSHARVTEA